MASSIVLKAITLSMLLVIAPSAYATGGMISGGGELLADSENPWFVNVKQAVTYCVESDEASFGLPMERVKSLISDSFNFWRQEISRGAATPLNGFTVSVIPAGFVFQNHCVPETDIRFQFGVLNSEQREILPDPARFVAAALRTDYDEKQLRGRGFIYVSPESGPLRMRGHNLRKEPWKIKDGKLLYYILLHELGHVFGIPHHGERYSLMSAESPELMVQENTGWEGTRPTAFPQIFRFQDAVSGYMCNGQPNKSRLFRLLGLPVEFPCHQIKVTQESVDFYVGESGKPYHWVKRIELDPEGISGPEEIIQIRLNDKQTAFPGLPAFVRYMTGPQVVHDKRQGSFVNQSTGQRGIISLDLRPGCFSMDVFQNGELHLDLGRNCLR